MLLFGCRPSPVLMRGFARAVAKSGLPASQSPVHELEIHGARRPAEPVQSVGGRGGPRASASRGLTECVVQTRQ